MAIESLPNNRRPVIVDSLVPGWCFRWFLRTAADSSFPRHRLLQTKQRVFPSAESIIIIIIIIIVHDANNDLLLCCYYCRCSSFLNTAAVLYDRCSYYCYDYHCWRGRFDRCTGIFRCLLSDLAVVVSMSFDTSSLSFNAPLLRSKHLFASSLTVVQRPSSSNEEPLLRSMLFLINSLNN